MIKAIKRFLKYFLATTVLVITSITVIIIVSLNVVFTSDKITPIVSFFANQNLNAELKVESIDLTFFSTFPHFSLDIKNGVLIKKIIPDSLRNNNNYLPEDSLISFSRCIGTFNPIALIQKNKISISELSLDNPKFHGYISKDGKTNWDIIELATDTTEQKKEKFGLDINLKSVSIKNGNFIYNDQSSATYASLNDLNFGLSVNLNKKEILLGLNLKADDIGFQQQQNRIIDSLSLALNTNIEIDRKTKKIRFKNADVALNNIDFNASGEMFGNKEKKELDVEIDLDLKIPTIQELIKLVPAHLFEKGKEFEAKGEIQLSAKIKGIYGNGGFPIVSAHLEVENGGIKNKTNQKKIQLFETEIDGTFDFSKRTASKVDVKSLKLKGASTNISLKGTADDLFKNISTKLEAKGNVDFQALSKSIPLPKGVKVMGDLSLDLNGKFKLNDILKVDYGKIDAVGKVKLSKANLTYKNDILVFKANEVNAVFGQKKNLKTAKLKGSDVFGGYVKLSELSLNVKERMSASLGDASFYFVTVPKKDTSSITIINSNITLNKLKVKIGDSIRGVVGNTTANIKLKPSKDNPEIPTIQTDFKIDSAGLLVNKRFVGIKEGKYNFNFVRQAKKKWPATGYLSFSSLYAYSPMFPLLIKMPQTTINVKPGLIELNEAVFEIGKSDITVSGKIFDIEKTLIDKQTLRAELEINSDTIHFNQIIKTINDGVTLDDKTIEEVNKTIVEVEETTDLAAFVVPKGINFKFKSHFKNVVFGKLNIENLNGLIKVENQEVHLANLSMQTYAANLKTNMRYKSIADKKAKVDFEFFLTDIDIKNLVLLMPALDSLFPMANSFEGNVNFAMQGKSNLSSEMGIELPSLKAVSRIEGQNLILLDGDTFDQLSKMLMFKNKEKNIIDSLSFEILVENSIMEIFPSLIMVDRYQVAVGGQHKLDMTYNYHVSVLKSPMPFKAGVDLIGDLNDYDLKITKAKFKFMFSEKERQREKANKDLIRRKEEIIKMLHF